MLRNARKSTGGKVPKQRFIRKDTSELASTTTRMKNESTWNWEPVMDGDNNGQSNILFTKRRRFPWEHFIVEAVGPDCKRAQCKHCNKSLAYITRSKHMGTSHLKRHIASHDKPKILEEQSPEEIALSKKRKIDNEIYPCLSGTTEKEESLLEEINQEVLQAKVSEPSSNVQVMSRNLIAELSTRNSLTQRNQSCVGEISNSDFLQRQKQELSGFLNMSLEAIHQANSFNTVKNIVSTLIQCNTNDFERTNLMKLLSCLVESEESIPAAVSAVETAKASVNCLTRIARDLDGSLVQRLDQLSSLETRVSKLSDEEAKLEAEIQRLIAQKAEVVNRKNSSMVELEKINQRAAKDLEEWRNRKQDLNQANENWLRGKENLDQANARWRLFKENLGFYFVYGNKNFML